MLFSDHRYILQIFKNKLYAYQVDIKGLKIVETLEQEFNGEEDLPEKLLEVKQVFKKESFFLLIPEEKAKLYLFKLPLETKNVVGAVEEQLGLQAEDKLSNLTYDLRKMGADEEEGVVYHQVIVAQKSYLKDLKRVFDKAEIRIETIENPSFALARLTKNVKVPHLVYYKDLQQRVLCACFEGEVFAALSLDVRKKIENAGAEMIDEVKGRYGFEIKSVLCSPAFVDELEEVKDLRIKEEELLHPALGLVLKKDIGGADLDVLSLKFPEVEFHGESIIEKMNWKLVFSILIMLIILIGGGFLLKNLWGKANFKALLPSARPTPTNTPIPGPKFSPTPLPTVIPTPTPLNKADLKIQILNGSGTTGVATRAQVFLTEDGWVIDTVANADRYDYENTQIKIKKSKEVFAEMLKTKLSEKYAVADVIGELSEDNSVDAIVIIGKT